MLVEAELPDDPALLRAMLVEAPGEIARHQARIVDLGSADGEAKTEIERLTGKHPVGAASDYERARSASISSM